MVSFLGLNIVKDDVKETVTLFQQGLIDRIVRAINLEESNPNSTPAKKVSLYKDLYIEACSE